MIPYMPVAAQFRLPMLNLEKAWYEATRFYGPYNYHPDRCEDWNLESGGDTDLGEPLVAPFNGIVSAAKDYGFRIGKVVQIIGVTRYYEMIIWGGWHLEDIKVQTGEIVYMGDEIGTIGNADGQYAAHLHEQICILGGAGIPGPTIFASNNNYNWQQPSKFYVEHGVDAALVERLTKKDGA